MNAKDMEELEMLRNERRETILLLPEADGRTAMAEALANSGSSVASAKAVLAAAALDEGSTAKKSAAIMANHKALCGSPKGSDPAAPRNALAENMKRILAANQRG